MWYCLITNYQNENNEHQKFDAVCVEAIVQFSSLSACCSSAWAHGSSIAPEIHIYFPLSQLDL